MADKAPHSDTPQKPYFVSIGNFLAVSYWIIEAYFDSVLIEDTSFTMRLFPSDPNELWMRSLVSVLFVGFGLYARGHFPICIYCKKIRDEDSQWVAPDRFISAQTEAEFSHAVCDKCLIENR
jgi:hypothetical protein